ncbi:hypothetical protein NFI96_007770 [Prochilodus magdalenae]|nr:hypothetical protein NFI96_007770 [Prochilodus magdalenae]
MKYKKFITIMQAAIGIAPLNKRELLPPGRKLWRPSGDQSGTDVFKFYLTKEAQYLCLRRLSAPNYITIVKLLSHGDLFHKAPDALLWFQRQFGAIVRDATQDIKHEEDTF